MAKDTKQKQGFLTGAIFGTLIGAVAALLFAPKAGKETQADIKETAKQTAKKVVHHKDEQLAKVETELEDKIDHLKVASRELDGEAYEDSQRLITRAELLQNDLKDSAQRLAKGSDSAKKAGTVDVKRLVGEGNAVMADLERMTKRVMQSANNEISEQIDGETRKK